MFLRQIISISEAEEYFEERMIKIYSIPKSSIPVKLYLFFSLRGLLTEYSSDSHKEYDMIKSLTIITTIIALLRRRLNKKNQKAEEGRKEGRKRRRPLSIDSNVISKTSFLSIELILS